MSTLIGIFLLVILVSIPHFLETLDSKIILILLENDALHHQGAV